MKLPVFFFCVKDLGRKKEKGKYFFKLFVWLGLELRKRCLVAIFSLSNFSELISSPICFQVFISTTNFSNSKILPL